MKDVNRLKKNQEFQIIFQQGYSVANRQFVVYQLKKENQTAIRIGMSVSKKLGNAVMRNQIKRLIKEVLRNLSNELHQDRDVVIIARKPTASMDFNEMKTSLIHVLKVGKLYRLPDRIKDVGERR